VIHANFTQFRKRLAHYLDRANQDRDAILVTRQGSDPVVVIAHSEYEGLLETLHLMSSPANAKQLTEAIADANAGRNMIEVEWNEEAQAYKPV
jgi:antitoxin YefM